MKVLFVSSGNSKAFTIQPFIRSQGESLRQKGVDVEFFPLRGKGFLGYMKNIKKIRQTIRQQQVDIVHAHYSLTGWVVWFAAPFKPRVLSLMGSDTHGGNLLKSIRLFMTIQLFLIQFIFPKIIVKSGNLSKVLWAKKKTEIIPNGVNYHVFIPINKIEARKKLGLEPDDKYILFMANPKDSNKNFALLQQSMAYLQTAEVKVLSPFPVKHDETVLYYNACDILIFPSIKEGSPNVIKEALACNTNIVATPAGDIPERTKGIKNVLLSGYDAKELAGKIDQFLQNEIKFDSRKAIRDEIDDDLIADRIINIYKSLLN